MYKEGYVRGEQTRDLILKAAHDLFVKQGYHGTSMRQIAQKAEVALGSVYNHFNSKEEIFRAVFLEFHPYHEIIPALVNVQSETVEDFVRDVANRMIQALEKRPYFLNLLFIETVEFENIHSHELFENLFPTVTQIIQTKRIKNKGRLREIPDAILFRSFLGLFIAYYLTELVLTPIAPSEFQQHAIDYFVDIYLHGIMVKN